MSIIFNSNKSLEKSLSRIRALEEKTIGASYVSQSNPNAGIITNATQNIAIWGDSVCGDWGNPNSWAVEGASPTHPPIPAFKVFHRWDGESKVINGSNFSELLASPYNVSSGTIISQGVLNWAPNAKRILGGRRRFFNGAQSGKTSKYIKENIFDYSIDEVGVKECIHFICIGQNSFANNGNASLSTDVDYGLSLVLDMIETIGHDRYIVTTLTNISATGSWVSAYNELLRQTINPKNLFDLKLFFQQNADGGAIDAARVLNDDIPASLMKDNVHLSDLGYVLYGYGAAAKIIENNW